MRRIIATRIKNNEVANTSRFLYHNDYVFFFFRKKASLIRTSESLENLP